MKRFWDEDADAYLVSFHPIAGPAQMAHDLACTEDQVRRRVAKLRKTGAWRHLEIMLVAQMRYQIAVGQRALDYLAGMIAEIEGRHRPALTTIGAPR